MLCLKTNATRTLEPGFTAVYLEGKDDEEEERRLFYVALTRARKRVFLSYAGIRTIFGSQQVNIPSEFISDIPADLIESEDRDEGTDVISQARNIFIDW